MEAALKPHRLERYLASDDPKFDSKAADILGSFLNPPQHAAVFCIDEKTTIQALDRLDPVLPLSPGRAERHGFEYHRRGTLSLYAALETKTGRVYGKTPHSRNFVGLPGRSGVVVPAPAVDSYHPIISPIIKPNWFAISWNGTCHVTGAPPRIVTRLAFHELVTIFNSLQS